jgi:hypothetical protein
MTDRTVKVVGKHIKGCAAVREEKAGRWSTCWGPVAWGEYGQPIVRTMRRYGKTGRAMKTWLRYVCNDPDCKAELHVDTDYIVEGVAKMQGPNHG